MLRSMCPDPDYAGKVERGKKVMSVFVLVGMSIAAMACFVFLAVVLSMLSYTFSQNKILGRLLDYGMRIMVMSTAISGVFSVIAVVSGMLMIMGVGL